MRLLRFKEKHSDRNFVFETDAERDLILVKVARDRLAEGYWYSDEPKAHPDLFRPNAHLSDAETIGALLAKLDNPALRPRHRDDAWYRYQIARWMIARCRHEYEDFAIDRVESV